MLFLSRSLGGLVRPRSPPPVQDLAGRRPFHHPGTGVASGVWPDAGRSTPQERGYRPGFDRTPAVPPPKDRGIVRGLAGRRLFRYPGGENGGELNRPGTVTEKACSTHLLTFSFLSLASFGHVLSSLCISLSMHLWVFRKSL